jgi:AcrR family transcriptional regulator
MVKSSGLSKRSKPAPSGRGRSRAAADGSEERILAAARTEFIAKGLDGARMQNIAERAGVNKALVHYYYRSKEKLYHTVLQEILEAVWGKITAEFQAQGRPEGLEPVLHTLVSTYVRTLADNPEFPLFVFREVAGGGRSFQPLVAQTLERFGEVPAALFRALRSEIMAGRARPIHPVHFFMNVMGMCVITFLARPLLEKATLPGIALEAGERFLEERVRAVTEMALHGVLIAR